MPLLEINDLIVLYGEIEALRGVSISVDEGRVVTLLGANGAGKSTTLRAISGLAKPRQAKLSSTASRSLALGRRPSCVSASLTFPKAGGFFQVCP
jgi:ABC-type branched-chain amino acid transport systems, ATPase component